MLQVVMIKFSENSKSTDFGNLWKIDETFLIIWKFFIVNIKMIDGW